MRLVIAGTLHDIDGRITDILAPLNAPLKSIDAGQRVETRVAVGLSAIEHRATGVRGSLSFGRVRSGFQSSAHVAYGLADTWIDLEYGSYKIGRYADLVSILIEQRISAVAVP